MRALINLRTALTLAAVAALLLTACASETEAASDPKTVDLTAESSGSTVSIRPGDTLRITLESNVTTGYAWRLETEPATEVLDLTGSDYVAPDTDLVGAGGEEVWRFVATGEGTTDLALSYVGPSADTAGEPFIVTIEVAS
jgi:inhibitor of cysteine peptidase